MDVVSIAGKGNGENEVLRLLRVMVPLVCFTIVRVVNAELILQAYHNNDCYSCCHYALGYGRSQ